MLEIPRTRQSCARLSLRFVAAEEVPRFYLNFRKIRLHVGSYFCCRYTITNYAGLWMGTWVPTSLHRQRQVAKCVLFAFFACFICKKRNTSLFQARKRFTMVAFGRTFENYPRKKELSRIDGGNWYSPVEADFLLDAKSVNSFNPVSGS